MCAVRSVRAYHPICQHDKLPLVYLFIYLFIYLFMYLSIYLFIYLFIYYLCMNFVPALSQKRIQQSSSNIYSIFAMIRNRSVTFPA